MDGNTTIAVATIIGAIAACSGAVAIIKFWMDAGAARKSSDDAAKSAADAHTRIDGLISTLAEFRVSAQRDFASSDDMINAERRFTEAVDGLRRDFNRMGDRFDALVGVLIKQNNAAAGATLIG